MKIILSLANHEMPEKATGPVSVVEGPPAQYQELDQNQQISYVPRVQLRLHSKLSTCDPFEVSHRTESRPE